MQRLVHRGDDGVLAGEPAGAGHPACEIALVGVDNLGAARTQHLDIFLRSRVVPHVHVHRRSDNHGRGAGEVQRGKKVVGDAARKFRKNIGGCGSDEKQVRALRDGDVLDGAFQVGFAARFREKIGDDFLPAQRSEGQRRDEFASAARHHHLHAKAILLQTAHQFRGFVGRDSTGDA